MKEKYDVVVVGAGPVGIFAAYFAKLHSLKTLLVESLSELGGQPTQLYPAKKILDIPLFGKITGAELGVKLTKQLQALDVPTKTNYKVTAIKKTDEGYLLNDELLTKSVIIATGGGAFKPKTLPLDLTPEVNAKLKYFVKNPADFAHKNVAVLGGGDSALDLAGLLAENQANVTIIHRRPKFRGLEHTVKLLEANDNVDFLTPFLPTAITQNADQLELTLKKVKENSLHQHTFDEIVVAYGMISNNDFMEQWDVTTKKGLIPVNQAMQSEQELIYAVGDVATYPHRVPVIALGFGEAQIAVNDLARRLYPEKTMTLHSTSL